MEEYIDGDGAGGRKGNGERKNGKHRTAANFSLFDEANISYLTVELFLVCFK